jgi:chemotaxis protein MotB
MNAVAEELPGSPEDEVAEPAPPKASGPPPPPPAKKCPECVPGAPMWMATFSDMATLLLCFFVLILSFAEMNVPKFKQISGSLQNAFGVQREVPVVEQPKGTTILSLSFSPSPTVALVDNLKQETTDTTQPDIEIREKDADITTDEVFAAAGRKPQDTDRPGAQGSEGSQGSSAPDSIAQDAERVRQALAAEVAAGRVEVAATNTRVTVQFNAAQNATAAERTLAAQAVVSGMQKLNEVTPQLSSEVAVTGATSALVAAVEAKSATSGADTTGQQGGGGSSKEKRDQAAEALEQAFAGEIKDGLVKVERKDGAVIVKIGSGGAFPTGDATLTPLAIGLIEKIGDVARQAGARIVIGGHTDNVPINTVRYRDNWDLSAARAISVVRELVTRRGFDAARIEAQGFADTKPVAPNDTAANRGLNRRIEIEIQLPKE